MVYAALPPEIISARMYSGPGSDPMLAAASAWGGLAAEMTSVATSYEAMITSLASEEWMGPASAAMVAAAKPYLAWLSATAAHAEQSTTQARTAAAAFEQAYAMTVPPAMIAANREMLQLLMTTNVMGQNAGAIATVEAQYGEMWAQDSLAMHTYAAQSAAAATLEPFAPPPETTNLGGTAGQAAAVARANADAAATKTLSAAPKALDSLATSSPAPATAADPPAPMPGLSDLLDNPAYQLGLTGLGQTVGVSNLGGNVINAVWRGMSGVVGAARLVGDGAAKAAGAAAKAVEGAAGAAGGLGGLGAVAGGLGNAGILGGLSVPSSWAAPAAAAAFGPVSGGTWQAAGGASLAGALSEAAPHGLPGMPGVPAAATAAGMAGRGGGFGMGPRYGFKVPVMPRIPL